MYSDFELSDQAVILGKEKLLVGYFIKANLYAVLWISFCNYTAFQYNELFLWSYTVILCHIAYNMS